MSDRALIEAVKQAICDDLDRQMQSGPEHLYLAVDLHALAIAAVKAMTDFAKAPAERTDR